MKLNYTFATTKKVGDIVVLMLKGWGSEDVLYTVCDEGGRHADVKGKWGRRWEERKGKEASDMKEKKL